MPEQATQRTLRPSPTGSAPGSANTEEAQPAAVFCMQCMSPLDENGTCPSCGHDGSAVTPPHQLAPGTVLEQRYLIGNVIGQGGFGITYIGRDLTLNMRVAIKEYYPTGYANRNVQAEDTVFEPKGAGREIMLEGKRRFLDEARVLAKFHDTPGIVDVRDYFEANNTAYIIMDYLDGISLREFLSSKKLSADDTFARMAPIMDALERVHAEHVVHRDISPDNIMLLSDGSLRLMDFGAARVIDYGDTRTVSMVLKAGYAPEEQYRAKGTLGPWTDIYALCATMYKCITGITPDDSLQRLYGDEMQWPSKLGVPIEKHQEAVLKKGMAPHAKDRYQSIAELKADLARNDDTHMRKRSRPIIAAIVAIAVIAAALACFALWPRAHTVSFDTTGGSAIDSVQVQPDAALEQPTAPTRAGYSFAGWYLDAGLSKQAAFPLAVNADTTLYAAWDETKTCTVRYLRKTTGEELAEAKTVQAAVGSELTEKAPKIKSYKLVGDKQQTIVVSEDEAGNAIEFAYRKKTGYTVRYLDRNTGAAVKSEKRADGKVEGQSVTEKAPSIGGYALSSSATEKLELSATAKDNRIVFYYTAVQTSEPVDDTSSYSSNGSDGSSGSSNTASSSSSDVEWAN